MKRRTNKEDQNEGRKNKEEKSEDAKKYILFFLHIYPDLKNSEIKFQTSPNYIETLLASCVSLIFVLSSFLQAMLMPLSHNTAQAHV